MISLIAIDPATYSCGWAHFLDGTLTGAGSFKSKDKCRIARTNVIMSQLWNIFVPANITHAAIEDPMLQGRNNQGMQRFIGAVEMELTRNFNSIPPDYISHFHPFCKFF